MPSVSTHQQFLVLPNMLILIVCINFVYISSSYRLLRKLFLKKK